MRILCRSQEGLEIDKQHGVDDLVAFRCFLHSKHDPEGLELVVDEPTAVGPGQGGTARAKRHG